MDKIVLDGELSLNIPLDGEVGLMSLIEVGIAEIRFNSDYTITFVMTDGRTYTSEPVRGADGEKGDTGSKGDKGDPFVYEDFTPEQLTSLKGEKGDKGDQGIQGVKGDTGESGVYIGADEPIDERIKVWIDTSEDTDKSSSIVGIGQVGYMKVKG